MTDSHSSPSEAAPQRKSSSSNSQRRKRAKLSEPATAQTTEKVQHATQLTYADGKSGLQATAHQSTPPDASPESPEQTLKLGRWIVYHSMVKQPSAIAPLVQNFISNFNFWVADKNEISFFEQLVVDIVSTKGDVAGVLIESLAELMRSIVSNHPEQLRAPAAAAAHSIDVGSEKFHFTDQVLERCREILIKYEVGIILEGGEVAFMKGLLNYHPEGFAKKSQMQGIGIMSGTLTDGVAADDTRWTRKAFAVIKEGGVWEDFSYVTCCSKLQDSTYFVLNHLKRLFSQLSTVYPRSKVLISQALERWPSTEIAIHNQAFYLDALLWISCNSSCNRHVLLKSVVERLVLLDTHQCAKPMRAEFETWKAKKLQKAANDLENELISVEEAERFLDDGLLRRLFDGCRTEEHKDPNNAALDELFLLLLTWLSNQIHHGFTSEVSPHAVAGVFSESDAPFTDSDNECGSSGDPSRNQAVTLADVLAYELFELFESLVLPSPHVQCVQFLVFYLCGQSPQWTAWLLQRLFRLLFDPSSCVSSRCTAASYIASLVGRGKFVTHEVAGRTVNYLVELAAEIQSDVGDDFDSTVVSTSHASAATIFHKALQAAAYIVCLRADEAEEEEDTAFRSFVEGDHQTDASKRLSAVLGSEVFRPLCQMDPKLFEDFIATCRRLDLLASVESIFREAERELSVVRNGVIPDEDASANDSPDGPLRASGPPSSEAFPFDTILLCKSRKMLASLHRKSKPCSSAARPTPQRQQALHPDEERQTSSSSSEVHQKAGNSNLLSKWIRYLVHLVGLPFSSVNTAARPEALPEVHCQQLEKPAQISATSEPQWGGCCKRRRIEGVLQSPLRQEGEVIEGDQTEFCGRV